MQTNSASTYRAIRFLCLLLAAVLLAGTARAQSPAPDGPPALPAAVSVDDAHLPGRLTAIDDKWNLTFVTETDSRKLPAENLVRYGRPAELRRGPVIALGADGLLQANVKAYSHTEGFFHFKFSKEIIENADPPKAVRIIRTYESVPIKGIAIGSMRQLCSKRWEGIAVHPVEALPTVAHEPHDRPCI